MVYNLHDWLDDSTSRNDQYKPIPISQFNNTDTDSIFITFDDRLVYDLSKFCKYHPGGEAILLNLKGTNIKNEFGNLLLFLLIYR